MPDVKFSEFDAATIVNGDEDIVGLQDGVNTKFSLDVIKAFLKPYKEYTALLSFQSGTGFAATVVLVNEFPGVVFTWSSTTSGLMTLTADTAIFAIDKTGIPPAYSRVSEGFVLGGERSTQHAINFFLKGLDGTTGTNPYFSGVYVTIRVYN